MSKYPLRALIVTECVKPPIPTCAFDWMAYIDGETEAGLTGRGPNETEALRDLCEQLAHNFLATRASNWPTNF